MKLKPLEQWVCDSCGEIIENVEDGWVEWIKDEDNRNMQFHIVHLAPKSPRFPDGYCNIHKKYPRRADGYLHEFVGTKGLVKLLRFIDVGKYHEPTFRGPWVKNLREWTKFFRRLQLPYYEEARLYWDKAIGDNFLGDLNPVSIYMPETLKSLIEQYCE